MRLSATHDSASIVSDEMNNDMTATVTSNGADAVV